MVHQRKSVMIFGAGWNQLELIREARALGLMTVVVDPQHDPPGKPEADFFYRVDGNEYNATREIAVRHGVSGIVTGQMEKPLRLMARLAADLGLIFNSPEVTERATDKWLMKQAYMAAGVPCAKGSLIRSEEELAGWLKTGLEFPVIIKPRDAYSSRGVFRCSSAGEIIRRAEMSSSFSSNGDFLIEEFIDGPEFSIEAVTFRGETTIIQFTEKFITPYPRTVETGHIQPAGLTREERESVAVTVKSALRALGIENSASHTEVKIADKGPVVIETGARLGGDFIASYLTKASTGVSMDRAAVQIAIGLKPDTDHSREAFAMIRFPELPAGKRVIKVDDTTDIENLPGVVFAKLFVKPGDRTEEVLHSGQRAGCILTEGRTRDEVMESIDLYSGLLTAKAELI